MLPSPAADALLFLKVEIRENDEERERGGKLGNDDSRPQGTSMALCIGTAPMAFFVITDFVLYLFYFLINGKINSGN